MCDDEGLESGFDPLEDESDWDEESLSEWLKEDH